MAASTNYALARRAVDAATRMERWSKTLRQAMREQGFQLDPIGDGSLDGAAVKLSAWQINLMVLEMLDAMKDIRKFKAPGSN